MAQTRGEREIREHYSIETRRDRVVLVGAIKAALNDSKSSQSQNHVNSTQEISCFNCNRQVQFMSPIKIINGLLEGSWEEDENFIGHIGIF